VAVEPIQRGDKFNLSWFLPAVCYRRLLRSAIRPFTLQLLGLATAYYSSHHRQSNGAGEPPTLDVMAIALLGVAVFEALYPAAIHLPIPPVALTLAYQPRYFVT